MYVKMAVTLWILVCAISLNLSVSPAESARVLCVGVQMDSHTGELTGATERLQDYGHELYLLVNEQYPKPERYEKKGFKILKYHHPAGTPFMASDTLQETVADIILSGGGPREVDAMIMPVVYDDCRRMMADLELRETIKSLKFDLIVADGFIICPCILILPVFLDVPFVIVSSLFHPLHARIPALPHFTPTVFGELSNKMTLWEKFINVFITTLIFNFPFPQTHDVSLLREYNMSGVTWRDLTLKTELFITSRNYVMEWPTPTTPNFITVPGLSSVKPQGLDTLFSKLMDSVESSSHGVIIMTFGSAFSRPPTDMVQKFLEAFERMDQIVIWKLQFKSDQKFKLPSNVYISAWLPQASLLAHPNTRLFITHCGNGGQHEATYHGVPMLGVPLFAEQPHNAHRMEQHGIGRRLNFLSMTSDDIYENIMELLSNPSYKEKSQKMSRILKDRPMSGQEEAAYWINHVIQFGGAHLRSSTMDMPLWEFWMLDMLMVVIVCLIVVTLLLVCCVRVICKKLRGKSVSSGKKKLQ